MQDLRARAAKRVRATSPQTIPLVAPTLAILVRRSEQANGDWVFPGQAPDQHAKTFRKPWTRLLKRAALTDVRPHDVRRTLGSWLTKGGTALPVVSRALGHSHISTTLIYTRSEDPELRQALEATATKMLEAGNGAQ